MTPVEGEDFSLPTKQEFEYFAARGMNLFRVLFFWEMIQPEAKKELSRPATDRLKAVVKTATDLGLTVILDPHHSARSRDAGRQARGRPVRTAAGPIPAPDLPNRPFPHA